MKTMLKVLAIFAMMLGLGLCSPLGAQTRYFHLNQHPENSGRQPDRTELGLILAHDSPIIKIGGANNSSSTGILPAGVVVVIDEESKVAKWVGICGNTILTQGWKPEGKILSYKEVYQKGCEEMVEVLKKLDNIQGGVNELLARPLPLTQAELDASLRNFVATHPPQGSSPDNHGSWVHEHPVGTVMIVVAVVVIVYIATRPHEDKHSGPVVTTGPPSGGLVFRL